MPKEYEAKFLDIDVEAVKKILKKNGAKKVQNPIKYRRMIFKRCEEKGDKPGFVRIRDEGDKVTMTTKVFADTKFPQEHEIVIQDTFEKGTEFLKSVGIEEKSYQETIREKWTHPLAHEITFDIIPGLPVYMEIDCTDENKLNKLITLLKLDKEKMQYGSYDKTFTEYYDIPSDVIINKTPRLTFEQVHKEIKPRKNIALFNEITQLNRTMKINRRSGYYKKYHSRIFDKFLRKRKTKKIRSANKKTRKKRNRK